MVAKSPAQQRPAGRLRFALARPLLYPVAAADLPAPLRARAGAGARFAGAIFPLDLSPVRRGERYAAARLAVDLRHADPYRVIALAVHADAGEFGMVPEATTPIAWRARLAAGGHARLLDRLHRPGAAVDGVGTSRFGWRFADRRADPDLPRELAGHALLEIPAGVPALLGYLTAEADLTGAGLRRLATLKPMAFSVPIPDAPGPAPLPCLWLAAAPADPDADPDGITVAELLAAAAPATGIGARTPLRTAGRFAALPPDTDLARLVSALATAVARRDARQPEDRARLRFALHRTLDGTTPDEAGTGLAALLDAAAVRSALAEHRDAAFALVVPDALFRDEIAAGDGPPDPAAFRRIAAGPGGHAWLYLRRPGLPG